MSHEQFSEMPYKNHNSSVGIPTTPSHVVLQRISAFMHIINSSSHIIRYVNLSEFQLLMVDYHANAAVCRRNDNCRSLAKILDDRFGHFLPPTFTGVRLWDSVDSAVVVVWGKQTDDGRTLFHAISQMACENARVHIRI